MSDSTPSNGTIGVFYQARGADDDSLLKFQIFRDSYRRWKAGAEHQLYVIYKGFGNASFLAQARDVFADLLHQGIYLEDDGLDLGAYFRAASRVEHEKICFLNTNSKICGPSWLLKLAINLAEDVGMVSCSGNYEAPQHPGRDNLPYPNPHLRTNGFMIRRKHFLEMQPETGITDKMDAYMLEHGPASFTRRFASQGLKSLLVGKNGRGYEPAWWPKSETFRQGGQSNLLIADNRTQDFDESPLDEKRILYHLSWGDVGTRCLEGLFAPVGATAGDAHKGVKTLASQKGGPLGNISR